MLIKNDKIKLRLYINKRTKEAIKTIDNLEALLKKTHNGNYTLEVLDILTNIEQALADNVMASPTLIKDKPPPPQKVIGKVYYKDVLTDLKIA